MKNSRFMKRWIKGIITLGVITLLVFIGAGWYMINYSLKPADNTGCDIQGSYTYMMKEYPQMDHWLDSLRTHHLMHDTTLVNEEGTKLHGMFVFAPNKTNKTAIIVHGYTDNAVRMLMIGYLYNHDLKYNILLPDLYGHGESEGDHIQMGYKDRKDVIEWMNMANRIFGDSTQMVVHGISMGAATTMMVSGEHLPSYVKCFVEDCGYTSVWDEFSNELKKQFGLPKFPLLYIADGLCKVRYGWGFKEASPLKAVAKCKLPMFFIHGDADTFVPTEMVYPLYKAKPEPKELWVVPKATHAMSYRDYPQEYTNKVKAFTQKYIH